MFLYSLDMFNHLQGHCSHFRCVLHFKHPLPSLYHCHLVQSLSCWHVAVDASHFSVIFSFIGMTLQVLTSCIRSYIFLRYICGISRSGSYSLYYCKFKFLWFKFLLLIGDLLLGCRSDFWYIHVPSYTTLFLFLWRHYLVYKSFDQNRDKEWSKRVLVLNVTKE